MPYPYLGIAPRMYPQYRDIGADTPLQAEPGGSYDMAPVDGAGPVPVPPGDGLWGAHEASGGDAPPAESSGPVSVAGPTAVAGAGSSSGTPAKTTKSSKAAPAAEVGA